MCRKQPGGRWARVWNAYLITVLGSFAVLEGVALVREGSPATLTTYLRRVSCADQHCHHAQFGRLAIVGFFAWATAHLGWGILGFDGRRRRTCSDG